MILFQWKIVIEKFHVCIFISKFIFTFNIIDSFACGTTISNVLIKAESSFADEDKSPLIAGAVTELPPTKLTPEDTRLDVDDTESCRPEPTLLCTPLVKSSLSWTSTFYKFIWNIRQNLIILFAFCTFFIFVICTYICTLSLRVRKINDLLQLRQRKLSYVFLIP